MAITVQALGVEEVRHEGVRLCKPLRFTLAGRSKTVYAAVETNLSMKMPLAWAI
jgi:hypothetical protein